MKYLIWLLKAAIFFTLFAFALNNQQTAEVKFFFGTVWRAPMVLIVLVAFATGLALGVFVMVPRWWKRRHPFPQPTGSGQLPAANLDKNTVHDLSTIRHHGI
jgi:lipopolysaccharide assembly protein A